MLAAAQEKQFAVPEPAYFEYVPGKGVRAGLHGRCILAGNPAWLKEAGIELPTHVDVASAQILIARDLQWIGSIRIADQVRGEAAEQFATCIGWAYQRSWLRVIRRDPLVKWRKTSELRTSRVDCFLSRNPVVWTS